MSGRSVTPGRATVAGLAVLGLCIAAYLALFQVKVPHSVWDPLPGNGSAWILRRSPLVRWLGFPDAAIGVLVYAAEVVLDFWGDDRRASTQPWVVATAGVLAAGMAVGSLGLVALQAVFGHWCFLCLASAVLSVAIAALLAPEVRAAVRTLRTPGSHTTPARDHNPVSAR